ncbi:Rz1-like lysis system protein LysC [Bordetella trematum]|uniref:Rz1-like lysis system protein LysC n=1 Tax=Bordetella trematum TaxID=123899 RepID=UPI001BB26547
MACCLSLLQGCGNAPRSPAPMAMPNTCAPVVPCVLSASRPVRNEDLNAALDRVEADWAICAAQVDAVIACEARERNAQSH